MLGIAKFEKCIGPSLLLLLALRGIFNRVIQPDRVNSHEDPKLARRHS